MNKFYVTKDVAEKLRAKGYYREYDVTDEWVEGIFYQVEDGTFHLPRLDEVLAWLRDEKKIYVYPNYLPSSDKWICLIYDINEPRMYSVIDCVGFTESELLGIEYVIDNLI